MRLLITVLIISSIPFATFAQSGFVPPKTPEELRIQILDADKVLFDKGFNECDMDALKAIMRDDVVMIHDQAGVDEGKEAFLTPVRENICNGGPTKPLRTLDEHTTEVFPLYENGRLYGAIQNGLHSFYLKEGNKEPYLTNRARFSHLWWLESAGWSLKTAISFDHMNPMENGPIDTDVLTAGFDRDEYIEFLLKAHNVKSLSIAIIENGTVQQVRTFGDLMNGVPAPVDTIYNVASLAKPVTALVALKLADKGYWDLDDPVAKFFMDPDLKDDARSGELTSRHILTHTSGLPNWRYMADSGRLSFEFRPGEKWQYSGEGFEILRQAIEAKTGQGLEELAQQYVFGPIGMTNTSYLFRDADEARIATRYDADGISIVTTSQTQANAAANLMTTAEDYGRLVAYLMAGADLSDELAKQLFEPAVSQKTGIDFGLGWSIISDLADGGFAFQHTGSDPGVRAIAIGAPEQGRGIIILSNSDNAVPVWQAIITEQLGRTGEEIVGRNR